MRAYETAEDAWHAALEARVKLPGDRKYWRIELDQHVDHRGTNWSYVVSHSPLHLLQVADGRYTVLVGDELPHGDQEAESWLQGTYMEPQHAVAAALNTIRNQLHRFQKIWNQIATLTLFEAEETDDSVETSV